MRVDEAVGCPAQLWQRGSMHSPAPRRGADRYASRGVPTESHEAARGLRDLALSSADAIGTGLRV